mgnify:FL=1|tara:strand:- start:570 stop:833 length:264 start_codon:yes stop_codon:yes gene_type:complete
MKQYRIQVKYKNLYVDEIVSAEDDKTALECLVKKVDSGEVIEKEGAGFENPDMFFLTFERVEQNATEVNIGETSVGVQVGNTSVVTG